MIVPVLWLSLNPDTPPRGYWDHGILEDVFSNSMWNTGFQFVHYESEKGVAPGIPSDHVVIVFPARAQVGYVKELNSVMSKFSRVVLMLTGDEESVFPVEKIKHDNIQIYVMSPREEKHSDVKYKHLGTGYPPQLHKIVTDKIVDKDLDWFFSGQVTHERRRECAEQLESIFDPSDHKSVLIKTSGFTQGIGHDAYYGYMKRAKVAPAPSGPETPDSFRLFEALENACVPIADTRVPKGDFSDEYWTFFFGEEPPFPILKEYEQLPGYIEDQVNDYPRANNRVFSWWIKKKREFVNDIARDVQLEPHKEDITVIIPTSPIKSHPDTSIIDETIKSVRHHLPNSEIIITFDGVRSEREDKRGDYEEFMRRMLWKCNYEYKNILPLVFDNHSHQVKMARKALEYVNTPLIMYVEQDTPLVTDLEIEFDKICNYIKTGDSNMVRFHFEASIPKDHEHMIHGMEPINQYDLQLLRTSQWSQRPHVASKAFYDRILADHFSEDAVSFIEDKMHGVLHEAYLNNGTLGWHQFKVHIYAPDGNIKRSYHTDGRAGEEKYDDTQTF